VFVASFFVGFFGKVILAHPHPCTFQHTLKGLKAVAFKKMNQNRA
jgi:hypothetical protein